MTKIKRTDIEDLEKKAREIKKDILEISYKASVGHIGSALSIADIITVLYFSVLKINPKKPLHPDRDRFILSKGHAAAALYCALYRTGFFSRKKLLTYCRDGGIFGIHPDHNTKLGIEATTGSLGNGLPIGTGIALGLKRFSKKSKDVPNVFVLVSDAELNEGSIWESIMFASHHCLNNLVIIVDDNGLQAFGKTKEVINMQPLDKKFKSFGCETEIVNGNDIGELVNVFKKISFSKDKPSVIIAKTIAGKGVSFMENTIDWHYLSLSDGLYEKAQNEISDINS